MGREMAQRTRNAYFSNEFEHTLGLVRRVADSGGVFEREIRNLARGVDSLRGVSDMELRHKMLMVALDLTSRLTYLYARHTSERGDFCDEAPDVELLVGYSNTHAIKREDGELGADFMLALGFYKESEMLREAARHA